MPIRNYWKSITTVASGIVAIGSAFIILDLEVPRPAWASEIKELASHIVELDSKVTSQQLDDTKLRLYENLREGSRYKNEGTRVPVFIFEERILLERKVKELETRLDYLRKSLE